ncbi:MAG TPA: four helix bundle protein [Desulfobacterales bacterium]|nr:four helix bundle protein [Desulfobacterales bacterium]
MVKIIRTLYREYRITTKFSTEERSGLTSQIRRAVVSISSNIAEIERMLKALIKSLENKPLNPWPLESLDPFLQLNWRRTFYV